MRKRKGQSAEWSSMALHCITTYWTFASINSICIQEGVDGQVGAEAKVGIRLGMSILTA